MQWATLMKFSMKAGVKRGSRLRELIFRHALRLEGADFYQIPFWVCHIAGALAPWFRGRL